MIVTEMWWRNIKGTCREAVVRPNYKKQAHVVMTAISPAFLHEREYYDRTDKRTY